MASVTVQGLALGPVTIRTLAIAGRNRREYDVVADVRLS